jgi:coenzyme F420-dependent glucose-6-phosphate dehydrogenase
LTEAARAAGKGRPPVVATRWCVLAESRREAIAALGPLRGMRVPGRGGSPDPAIYRETADSMDPDELLSSWAVAKDADELEGVYRPLIETLGADTIGICIASCDNSAALQLVSKEVLPRLRWVAR